MGVWVSRCIGIGVRVWVYQCIDICVYRVGIGFGATMACAR